LSCALHLRNIFVQYGRSGGANELRCKTCYASATARRTFGLVAFIIVLIIALIFFFAVWLPEWNRMP
jgi:hypothetical protein